MANYFSGENKFSAPKQLNTIRINPDIKKKEFSWVSFYRIFISVAEMIAIMAAEALTAGSATPAVVGIGLTVAGTNTVVDVSQKQFSIINTIIDYGTAIVPGIASVVKFNKMVSRIEKNTALVLNEARSAEVEAIKKVDREFIRRMEKLKSISKRDLSKFDETIKLAKNTIKEGSNEVSIVRILTEEFVKGKTIIPTMSKSGIRKFSANLAYVRNKIDGRPFTKIVNNIDELEKLYNGVREGALRTSLNSRSTQKEAVKALKNISPNVKNELLQGLVKDKTKTVTVKMLTQKKNQKVLDGIYKSLNSESATALDLLFQSAGILKPSDWRKTMELFVASISDVEAKSIGKSVLTNLEKTIYDAKGVPTRFSRNQLTRYLSSKKFNDQVVQRIQLIDPNDFGRAPVEAIYKFSKSRVDKWVKRSISSKSKKARQIITSSQNLDKALKKAGVKKIEANRYLTGFKTITSDPTGVANLTVLIFNKIYTAGKTGKNVKGKRDNLVRASDYDLIRLMEPRIIGGGVDYYWDKGKRKGWYVSRGGRRKDAANSIELNAVTSLFMAFIPINALRFVGSAVSNIVENVDDLIRGSYIQKWTNKSSASFYRSAINRTGRLLSRAVLGGVAKVASASSSSQVARIIGAQTGRELQRLTSITLSAFETKDSNGKFKLRIPANGATLGKAYARGFLTAGRSATLRRARKRNSFATRFNSNIRKLNIVRRIPSSITPNSILSPSKIGRFKW